MMISRFFRRSDKEPTPKVKKAAAKKTLPVRPQRILTAEGWKRQKLRSLSEYS